MAADALSDLLKTVRLTGATFFDVVASNPWVAEQPTREMVLPKVLPGAEHLISYHVVTEGRCYAGIIGQEPIAVDAGEVIVYTRGDAHVMSSHPGMRAQPVTQEEVDFATSGPLTICRRSSRPEIRKAAMPTGSASSSAWRRANRPTNGPAAKVCSPS
jgi:hypothetical protein